MARVEYDKKTGRRRIRIDLAAGKRGTVRLGKCSERDADQVCRYVNDLEVCKTNAQSMSRETAVWLTMISPKLYGRLAKVWLVEPRAVKESQKLGPFIDGYLLQRQDVKPGTMIVYKQAQRHLVKFMGEDRKLESVTPGDADSYRASLVARVTARGKPIARATIAKWCKYARKFFGVAKQRRLITENPFAHIKCQVHGNAARRVFVPAVDVQKVIDVSPDPQWKLLIALGRWGGLRVPSEAIALTWADVDWERNRITVRSSKTEHHEGGGVRVLPIFPELLPYLQKVYDAAPEGTEYVIARYGGQYSNVATQFVRYITAAGLIPWPKPWQNLRATRATELADEFPSHVCAAWLGHTEAVADEFYRSVTDDHFQRAISSTKKAGQNPGQYLHETVVNGGKPENANVQKTPGIPAFSDGYSDLHTLQSGPYRT